VLHLRGHGPAQPTGPGVPGHHVAAVHPVPGADAAPGAGRQPAAVGRRRRPAGVGAAGRRQHGGQGGPLRHLGVVAVGSDAAASNGSSTPHDSYTPLGGCPAGADRPRRGGSAGSAPPLRSSSRSWRCSSPA
jgi:hypothetical protein